MHRDSLFAVPGRTQSYLLLCLFLEPHTFLVTRNGFLDGRTTVRALFLKISFRKYAAAIYIH